MSEKKKERNPQVSIRGETYDKLKEHCEKHGVSVAGFVDTLCASFFAKGGDDAKTTKAKKRKDSNGGQTQPDKDHRKMNW